MDISRRKFFSFFGTGVALLAKPDLLLPQIYRPKDGELLFTPGPPIMVDWLHISWDTKRQEWKMWGEVGRWLPIDTAIKHWEDP